MHHHQPLVLLCTVFAAFLVVRANTEIVNFGVTYEDNIELAEATHWPTLAYAEPERLWHVQPALLYTPLDAVCEPLQGTCPHEVWLKLQLDDYKWNTFSRFTLRLSWPASYPADISMDIFTPTELERRLRSDAFPHRTSRGRTRLRYARIRVVDTGVRVPSLSSLPVAAVPIIVRLEPLYLGIIPASVVPVLIFLIPIVAFASVVMVPTIHRYLAAVAAGVRHELASVQANNKTD